MCVRVCKCMNMKDLIDFLKENTEDVYFFLVMFGLACYGLIMLIEINIYTHRKEVKKK